MRILKAIAVALSLSFASPALAAEAPTPPDTRFSFDGLFGTFDRASLQRGFQVYQQVCSSCHGMSLLSYRNLRDIGLSEDQVTAIAASVTVTDGPNDEGEMFERPGRLADRFRYPFANEQSARLANNGAYPPDLSVITKARKYGADYIMALLVGYTEPPPGVELMAGMHYNAWFAGNQIAMPNVLYDDGLEFADGTPATVEQMARDVSTFLAWAAEPEMETRRQMGVKVLIFLAILGGLVYATKRKVWADVEH
jgi:ubiquinol-cytochrome c reductase cytochrome c1 subunit